jgi:hypothetical protein
MGTLGKTDNGTGSTATSAARQFCSVFTASENGTLVSGTIRCNVSGDDAGVKIVVWADDAGAPGALLAVSDEEIISATSEAEYTLAFTGAEQITLVASTDYWIGAHHDDPSTFNFTVSRGTTSALTKSAQRTYASGPADPFGTTFDQAGPSDIYVTYDTGTDAAATVASATGTAPTPQASVAVPAGNAAATGAAADAAVQIPGGSSPVAVVADASATAYDASNAVSPGAGGAVSIDPALATATAHDASTSGAAASASAEVAAGTAATFDMSTGVSPTALVAAATASSADATTSGSVAAAGNPDLPTMTLELSTDPFDDASPVWTSITEYARAATVRRGRSTQLERHVAGTMDLVLDNSDRIFDPTYTSGPFYGVLAPMNRIRLRASWDGSTYDLFTGFVDGWPQNYHPSNRDATVNVQGTDLFGHLANVDLADPWIEATKQAPAPVWWLPLQEATSAEEVVEVVSGARFIPFGVELGEPAVIPDRQSSANFPNQTSWVQVTSELGRFMQGSSWSLGVTFVRPAYLDDFNYTAFVLVATSSMQLQVDPSDGTCHLIYGSIALPGDILQTSVSVADNEPHHIGIVNNADNWTMYLDGVAVDTASGTSGDPQVMKGFIGNNGAGNAGFNGRISDVMLWDEALTAADMLALADAAVGAWDGDTAAERIERILAQTNYPGTTDLEAGEGRCGAQAGPGTALSRLQIVDATEQGRFFIEADGVPTLHNRAHNITATRSTVTQATFSDDTAATGDTGATDVPIHAGALQFGFDKVQTINEVTVTSPVLPASVTVKDTTAQATYGAQTRSIQTVARSVRDAESSGQYLVTKYKDPQIRAEKWSVKPQRKPIVWPTVLGLVFGDRIVLERTPQGVGTQIQIPLYLEYLEHRIVPGEWVVTCGGIPAEPEASTDYWVLGTAGLGTDTRLYV